MHNNSDLDLFHILQTQEIINRLPAKPVYKMSRAERVGMFLIKAAGFAFVAYLAFQEFVK